MNKQILLATVLAVLVTTGLSVWGVISGGWRISELLALYCLQTILVGCFTFLRMRAAKGVLPHQAHDRDESRASVMRSFFFLVACFMVPIVLALVLFPTISIVPSLVQGRIAELAPGFSLSLGISFASQLYAYLMFVRSEAVSTTSVRQAQGWYFARILVLAITIWSAGLFSLPATVVLTVFVAMQALFDFLAQLSSRLEPQSF